MRGRSIWVAVFVGLAATGGAWAEGIGIGGRVVNSEGAPVAKAEVRLLPLSDALTELRMALEQRPAEAAARSLTDGEGRFRIEAPGAGLWRVRVESPGFVPAVADLQPLIEPVELPDAELVPDTGLIAKVANREGGAIPGALVVLRTERTRYGFGAATWRAPVRSAVTGEDGAARMPRGERERVFVSVSAPGFTHASVREPRGAAVALRLEPGATRGLQVLSAESRPEPGVLVAVGERPHPVGLTDENGGIAVRLSSGKPTPVQLLAPDGRRLETRVDPGGAREDRPHRLDLPARSALAGRLIDAGSRRGIAGGVVWEQGNPIDAAVSDSSGGFALGGTAGDRMRITAGAPGYMNHRGFEFQLSDDGRPGPTLALEPAAAIEGRVTDAGGEPVAGAEIDVRVRRSPGMMRIEIGRPAALPRAVTDARGAFRISPLDPDDGYDVRARAEGFAPAELAVTDLEPKEAKTGVGIVLSRGGRVLGRVVDGDEQPVREATVELEPARTRGGMGMIHVMDNDGAAPSYTETTGEDGGFVLSGVPDGRFDLQVVRAGFAKHRISGIELEQEDPEGLNLGTVTLRPGESVEGIVRDADGLPVEGVEVFVQESGPMMAMMMGGPPGRSEPEPDAVTDAAGWFAVDDLAAGERYAFRFRRSGYVASSAEGVELPRIEPLQVTLDPASDVSGLVLDEQGDPIAGAQVNLQRSRSLEMGGMAIQTMSMEQAASEADGRFLFEDQEPGRISLTAVASGYQEAALNDVEVPKGEDLEGVELPLTAGGIVEGRVLAPDGRAAIGASVTKVEEGRGMIPRFGGGAMTDGNGYYRLEGLPPGELSIEATHDDYPRTVRDIEVREGINALDLHFEGGHEVTGRVGATDGRPVAEAVVRLMPAGRYWGPEAQTEADGSFKLSGVQDGDYRVWVEGEGYAPSTDRNVKVAGEPVHGLEFLLEPGSAIVGRITGLQPEQFAEVNVRAEAPSFRGMSSSLVDFEGSYRLEHLLPGTYDVVATLAHSGRQAREQVVVDAGAGEVRADLRFEPGLTLQGRAVQGEAPIAGATVYAEGIEIDHEGWSQTDLDGRFSIEGLQAGRYRIHVRDWRTGLAHEEEFELVTSREIEIKVPTARVAGRIVDGADRQPLAGVVLTLTPQAQPGRGRLPVHTATTDLEGKFELGSIPDGSWRLAATKQGYAAESQPLTVQHARGPEDLRIEMQATEGLTLEARLPSGAPASELQVAVLEPGGAALVTGSYPTGENGRVRLSSVPPGTWTLVVSAAGSATANLQARAPGATIPLALPAATRLRVHVPALSESNALSTVQVRGADGLQFRTLSWNGQPRSEWRMSSGEIEFGSLPPGTWTVTVRSGDGRQWQGTAATSAGGMAELLLE